MILALNLLEGTLNYGNLHLLGRQPNSVQRQIHARLFQLVTTCDLSDDQPLSLVPGRSGHEFIDALTQLEHFAERNQLSDVKGYADGPVDFEKCAVGKITKEDVGDATAALYTSLNADRLKLVGTGKWRVQSHLRDELWLPYVEPMVLRHGRGIDYGAGPNFKHEGKQEYLKLARKWGSLGLLALTPFRPEGDTFTRIFNCYKSPEHDRQIGDQRLACFRVLSSRTQPFSA